MTEISIIYQDDYFIAVNKPAGVLSQSDVDGNESLIEHFLPIYKQKFHVLTRLDRPVSGCVLLARTPKSAGSMTSQVSGHKIEKDYLALVERIPDDPVGTIENYLWKRKNKAYISESKKGDPAITHYSLIGKSDRYFLLLLKPETGRFHHLRAHLAHIGCPIKGDVKYGARRSNKDRSIDLHAFRLAFDHPFTHERVEIISQPKNEAVWNAMESFWRQILE